MSTPEDKPAPDDRPALTMDQAWDQAAADADRATTDRPRTVDVTDDYLLDLRRWAVERVIGPQPLVAGAADAKGVVRAAQVLESYVLTGLDVGREPREGTDGKG